MDGSWTLESIAELDMPARVEPTWTTERIELLKLLWDEGVTTA